ncbi:uncharacterized protein LOC119735181 [Patiria miniata]|uniref:Netrin receptor UNC5 n=1 Tax=Patiria miniata TaxID=46514 RepID=A0A914ALE4_PATMI|nr:uncharacterized protein LOC119735181 [Patiria miniata]
MYQSATTEPPTVSVETQPLPSFTCSSNCDKCLGPAENECTKCNEGFSLSLVDGTNQGMCGQTPFAGVGGVPGFVAIVVAAAVAILVTCFVCWCCRRMRRLRRDNEREREVLQAETSSVVQSPPEKEEKLQSIPPTPATHLKRILQEHDNFAKDCSEDTLKDNTFQLPYIAIGYFDHDGGSLSLGKYNVHLYIPRGALPKKSLQQVYIYVNPNAPPVDGIDPSNCVLSPMIQCGPTGLEFLDSVVLSFPHFAKEGSGWELRAQLCNGEEGSLKTWKTLDAGVDGVVVSTKGKTVVLLMKHFTGAALVGKPSATSTKIMQAGVFGSPFDQSEDLYSFRFHLWNNEPVVEQKVVEMEEKMGSQPLDTYRSLIVCRSGDVHAEIENIKEGWELACPALQKQTISVKRIWELPTDSFTFLVERHDCQMNKAPRCDGFICQISSDTEEVSNGDRVDFHFIPPRGSIPVTENQSPCYRCRNDEARSICPSCKEAMKCVQVLKNRDLSDGDYGGLSEVMVHIFCKKGDTARVVAELADVDHSSMEAQDSLKVFFGGQRARGVRDRTAVKRLLDSFDEPTVKNVRKKLRGTENSPDDGSTSMGKPEDRSRLASDIAIEKHFRRLAEKLGPKWETLATELGCSSVKLFKIKEDNPCNVDNQIFAMLVEWKKRCGWFDESILAEALEKAGRLDLAQQFREMTLKEDEHVL